MTTLKIFYYSTYCIKKFPFFSFTPKDGKISIPGTGEFLDSSNQYTLHFDADQIPESKEYGFWSLTMYGPDFQLVKNDIDRFSISDRTTG